MNTKNYVHIFIIGLICVVHLTIQPIRAEISSVADEQVQTDTHEEIIVIPPPQDVLAPTHQTIPEEVQTVQTSEQNPIANLQPKQEEPQKEEISEKQEITVQQKIYKHEKLVDLNRSKHKNEQKPQKSLFNNYSTVLKKYIISASNLIKEEFNKTNIFNNQAKPVKNTARQTTYLDIVPYYFIAPPIQTDYLKKIVFEDKVVKIEELMPYSYTVKNMEVKIEPQKDIVTPLGTTDTWVLVNAPSPQITVKEKSLFAKLVIDIRNNTLYKYDKNGFPLKAYLVATGAKGTRTMPGLRVVTYKERFPYEGAPESKRALDPYSYGPYILFLNAVEPKTGRQYCVEQLLHGNGNEYSIGKKVSHGCVRTNNLVMKRELSKEVKRGDYILLINPDND